MTEDTKMEWRHQQAKIRARPKVAGVNGALVLRAFLRGLLTPSLVFDGLITAVFNCIERATIECRKGV